MYLEKKEKEISFMIIQTLRLDCYKGMKCYFILELKTKTLLKEKPGSARRKPSKFKQAKKENEKMKKREMPVIEQSRPVLTADSPDLSLNRRQSRPTS